MKKLLFLFLFLIFACNNYEDKKITKTFFLMDSYASITLPVSDKKVFNDVIKELKSVESALDRRDNQTELWAFNEKKKNFVTNKIVRDCFYISLKIWKESQGFFDPSVANIYDLWRFDSVHPVVPSKEEIFKARKSGRITDFYLKEDRLERIKGTAKLDFGGIGQGYGLRRVLEILRLNNVKSALVDISGDIYALGKNFKNPWRIGVRNPFKKESLIAVLEVTNMAVITAGNYERGFTNGGIWYHHILDPFTGFPSRGVASVTVVMEDPVLADCWSTALVAAGEKSLEFSKKILPPFIMVKENGEVIVSSNMQRFIKKLY